MRTELYWVPGPWPGRIAIAPRPRGGDWLEVETAGWRQSGVDVVVSLLTPEEETDLDLVAEREACRSAGIEFLPFPVPDRQVPPDRGAFTDLLADLSRRLAAGETIAVHCRQGLGRAAVVAIGLLVLAGIDADAAGRRVTEARGRPVPETTEQQRWLTGFGAGLPVPSLT